jgi:hypothetical protein
MRYRPARFGGPGQGGVDVDPDWVASNNMTFLAPEEVAPMVLRAVRNNAPMVLDHANQRSWFFDHYANYVLEAFDEAERYDAERSDAAV